MPTHANLTDWLTAISAVVTALTALGAVCYAHFQLSNSRSEARIQHLLTFCHAYLSEPMTEYRVAAAEKYLAGETDSSEMYEVANFFEQIGLLVDRGYLDEKDAWEMFGYAVVPLFESCSGWISELKQKDRNAYTHLGTLYARLVKTERKNGGHEFNLSKSALDKYWASEKNAKPGRPLPGPQPTVAEKAANA